jgi:hypothetical protein
MTDTDEQHDEDAPEDTADPSIDGDSLEEAIAKLTPEQADMFMRALSLTMRKRRLMLVGNLLALLMLIIGMLFAFVAYGNRTPGTFVGWVFLVPLASAGFCLWLFGKLAKHAGNLTHKTLVEPLAPPPESSP